MKPLISICAALLGAMVVALSVWFGGGDAPSSSTFARASAADLECAPGDVCRRVVRVDAQGEPVDGGTAGAGTVVRLSPVSQKVASGGEVVVEVRVDNVQELAGYEFEIEYDWSALQFQSSQNGPFLGSTGRGVTCQPIQFGQSTVRYGCGTFGQFPVPPSGSGLLATVRFTACAGSTNLEFTENVNLANYLAETGAIPFTTQDGSADVNGGAPCATPTATNTPEGEGDPTFTPVSATSTLTPPQETPGPTATPEGPVGSPTPTVTGTPPTSTPTPTWTQVPTWTPQPTWTPPPTWTPDTGPATPTNTPVPPIALGDTGCDGVVGPEDATLILQWWAGLLDELPCPEAGDADGNGTTHLTDATVILQFSTGIVASLPPEESTPHLTLASTIRVL